MSGPAESAGSARSPGAGVLEGRRVVLTGASSGIGRATAGVLASAGAAVVLVARRRERLEAVAREVGGVAVPADVADVASVDRLRDRVLEEGTPDAVVNAAGGFEMGPVAETSPEVFDRMIDGNLRGAFLVTRAFLPAMLEAERGQVVTCLAALLLDTEARAVGRLGGDLLVAEAGEELAESYRKLESDDTEGAVEKWQDSLGYVARAADSASRKAPRIWPRMP